MNEKSFTFFPLTCRFNFQKSTKKRQYVDIFDMQAMKNQREALSSWKKSNMRKGGLGRLTLIRDKGFFSTVLSFALVFGEHNTTRCQESNSTGRGGEKRQKREGKERGGLRE